MRLRAALARARYPAVTPLAIRQSAASTGETIYCPSGTPYQGIVCLHGNEGRQAG